MTCGIFNLIYDNCIFPLTLFHVTLMLFTPLKSVTLKSSIFGAKTQTIIQT